MTGCAVPPEGDRRSGTACAGEIRVSGVAIATAILELVICFHRAVLGRGGTPVGGDDGGEVRFEGQAPPDVVSRVFTGPAGTATAAAPGRPAAEGGVVSPLPEPHPNQDLLNH